MAPLELTNYARATGDRGMDMLPKLLKMFENHPTFSETEKVRIDVLRRFGYYSTESNGHFSEYVPWYRKRVDEIPQWIDLSSWINGETGGYLRVCTEGRNWFETDFPNWMAEEPPVMRPGAAGLGGAPSARFRPSRPNASSSVIVRPTRSSMRRYMS